MFDILHKNKKIQLVFGFLAGILFGFMLQKGGVTHFDNIIGQLLLKDWRVVKLMLTAIIVGSIGIHIMATLKIIRLHPKPGSVGSTTVKGLSNFRLPCSITSITAPGLQSSTAISTAWNEP